MDTLTLNLLSPERRLLEQTQVEWVTLPTSEGQAQILPGHVDMIGTLHTGVFSYQRPGDAPVSGVISTGFFEVRNGEVSVMAETVELQNEIDLARAQKAQRNAETTLQEADLDESRMRKYQLKLQRALIRQQLASHQ